jgi:hypothetical protein
MRPKHLDYTLVALNDDGYIEVAEGTGAGPWTTFADQPGDGCSHPVTIYSAQNISDHSFVLTGTDAEGRTITETVTGPNATTVTSTKYFATLTSIVANATIGADDFIVGWTALARTPIYPVNFPGTVGPSVSVDMGGTCTFSVQYTFGDVFSTASDNLMFSAISGMSALTADGAGSAPIGATGIRVAVASHTSGTLGITHSQGRG